MSLLLDFIQFCENKDNQKKKNIHQNLYIEIDNFPIQKDDTKEDKEDKIIIIDLFSNEE